MSQRSSVQGTFWKKLLARGTNYKGRLAKLYEGFLGLPETDFVQKFVGKIDNITLDRTEVKVEIKDLLKSLSDIEVPPKLDIKLVCDMTPVSTEVTLSTVTGLDSPTGYVRLKDEIIYYTGVNPTTNQLTGLSRGYFGTTATEQKINDKVQKVRYYAPMNGFDILKTILQTDAGIDTAFIDTTNFDYWRDWPGGEVEFSAIVSEPTKLETLYFEIVDLLDCKSWVGEDLKITIRRNIPNEPGRVYHTITDDANIVLDSANVDLNAPSRFTRHLLYWDRKAIGKPDEVKDYNHLDIVIDADAENSVEYGDVIEKKIFCRWLRSGYTQEELIITYLKNTLTRQLFRQRDAQPILTLEVELKDSGIKTGSYIKVSTDELSQIDGLPLDRVVFQAVKRQQKENKVTLNLLQQSSKRWGFIAPNDCPDYTNATEAQKEYCFIVGNDDKMSDGSEGYYIY
ncbi:MAG: hypothetical protein WC623_24355 [Pedobacter sp.]|uniref:hypothetical protein n=1 Tax=Pedobacter sp. TaxID=1411316 RepID=UPI003564B6C9